MEDRAIQEQNMGANSQGTIDQGAIDVFWESRANSQESRANSQETGVDSQESCNSQTPSKVIHRETSAARMRRFRERQRFQTGEISGGLDHAEYCPTCHYPIPRESDVDRGRAIPCSPAHQRCTRCQWPVEKSHLNAEGLCVKCMPALERKNYYRRTDGSRSRHDSERLDTIGHRNEQERRLANE